ncbi:MAG: MBL fold metallo-hydrolase [Candidatus Omnitrophota bacterium]
MILEQLTVGPLEVNCYILAKEKNSPAIIIDPGADERRIKKTLEQFLLKPALIINTHGHIDHIGCDNKFGVSVYIHTKDAALLKDAALNLSGFLSLPFTVEADTHTVEDKELIDLGGIELEVLHLPGHTPGGIALLLKRPKAKILFSGDSLFYRGVGRTDFPGADGDLLIRSIKEKLLVLPEDTIVYPGHGPTTTIGEEKRNNPFLSPHPS